MQGDWDVCVIGSGAGGAPVAFSLARAGVSVVVLEKGPWFTEQDFFKDELACCRRNVYTPALADEQHVIEDRDADGNWVGEPTSESGWDFWNGNCVGGSSNFMSGFFYRLKPRDFHLASEFGPIKGANVADWPIDYDELEPWYTLVEREVGVSGRVTAHPYAEPRSTPDFPFPPTAEHPIARHIDAACEALGFHVFPTPRAILSRPRDARGSCEYSGYCGSYGCSTAAKGGARAALLGRALATGNCEVRPHTQVRRLLSDASGRVTAAECMDADDRIQQVRAKVFVVACQAIESSRLLLASPGPRHPEGLGNRFGQVGRNLLFSAGGAGSGDFPYAELDEGQAAALKVRGPFVNRSLQDWYVIDDRRFGAAAKGGTIDFLLRHPNPIARAMSLKWDDADRLVWGRPLQRRLKSLFTEAQTLRYEIFCDWLPTDDCFVALDAGVRDRWDSPVARVRIGHHPYDLRVGHYLDEKARQVLQRMGAKGIRSSISGTPPQNLVAGGCRFGVDPRKSVLDADCRVHDVDNLYVSDGSFMPTGGSVPFTWTIYANAFRVAERIRAAL
jgi:choline dehydrogenase-like flavoprotein